MGQQFLPHFRPSRPVGDQADPATTVPGTLVCSPPVDSGSIHRLRGLHHNPLAHRFNTLVKSKTALKIGVASRQQLNAMGVSDKQLAALRRQGQLELIRRGWYARTGANPKARAAVASGGVLTGADALALHGAWDLRELHTHVRAHQLERIRTASGIVPHTLKPSPVCSSAVDDIDTALAVLFKDHARNEAVVVCDSLVNRGLVTMNTLEAASAVHPRGKVIVNLVDPHSESGTESWFRLWAYRHQISFRSQVWIPGVGRVDFLIGSRLVIECDSVAHHTSLAAYENDRARDLALKALGFEVIRLTYHQVLRLEEGPGQVILQLIRNRAHLGAVRTVA